MTTVAQPVQTQEHTLCCTRCNQPFWMGRQDIPTPDGYVSFIGADECEKCWMVGK